MVCTLLRRTGAEVNRSMPHSFPLSRCLILGLQDLPRKTGTRILPTVNLKTNQRRVVSKSSWVLAMSTANLQSNRCWIYEVE